MDTLRHQRTGFALLELLIVAVLIVLVVGGGLWYAGRGERARSTIEMGVEAERRAEDVARQIQSRNRDTTTEITGASSTPGEIDTSTWKTYRNEEYGFEVKYPGDWVDEPKAPINSNILSVVYRKEESKCGQGVGCSYPGSFFVGGIKKDSLLLQRRGIELSFNQFVQDYIDENLIPGADIHIKEVQVNGHSAVLISIRLRKPGPASVFVPHRTGLIDYSPSDVILIEGDAFEESKGIVLPIVDAMISTFQFTK